MLHTNQCAKVHVDVDIYSLSYKLMEKAHQCPINANDGATISACKIR